MIYIIYINLLEYYLPKLDDNISLTKYNIKMTTIAPNNRNTAQDEQDLKLIRTLLITRDPDYLRTSLSNSDEIKAFYMILCATVGRNFDASMLKNYIASAKSIAEMNLKTSKGHLAGAFNNLAQAHARVNKREVAKGESPPPNTVVDKQVSQLRQMATRVNQSSMACQTLAFGLNRSKLLKFPNLIDGVKSNPDQYVVEHALEPRKNRNLLMEAIKCDIFKANNSKSRRYEASAEAEPKVDVTFESLVETLHDITVQTDDEAYLGVLLLDLPTEQKFSVVNLWMDANEDDRKLIALIYYQIIKYTTECCNHYATLENINKIASVPPESDGKPNQARVFFENLPNKYVEFPGLADRVSEFMLNHYANDISKSTAFAMPTDVNGVRGLMPDIDSAEGLTAMMSSTIGMLPPGMADVVQTFCKF